MDVRRWWVVAAICGAGMVLCARAQTNPKAMPLWEGRAPGAAGDSEADRPTLTAFLPGNNPTGTAVVVAPGGGYAHLAFDKEGTDVARWLTSHGVAAFVLKYRLGPKYHHPVELEDAQRALRTVRSGAKMFGVLPDHIGIWGFSAGGHLAATAGTQFDAGSPQATDLIDRVSSRPDFMVLAYPVITLKDPYAHKGSREYLLGEHPGPNLVEQLSAETRVTKATPPTFLFATTDDAVVPVMNSVMFYSALVREGIPAEMHLFQHGPHGAGLAAQDPALRVWPELVLKWMRERGFASQQ